MPYDYSQMNSFNNPNINMGYNQMDPGFDSRQMMDPFMMPFGSNGFNEMGFGDFDDFNNPFFHHHIHHHFHHHFFHFPIGFGFGFQPFRRF